MTRAPQLTGPAGFTRTLLREGRRAPVSLPLEHKRVNQPPRMRWIADAIRKDALLWFFRRGGWQRRQVVAGGRRREGRAWDAGIYESLGVRFSPASLELLVAAMRETQPDLPPLLARPDQLERLEGGLQGSDPATGDLLALHRLVELLAGPSLDAEPPFPLIYEDDGAREGLPALERDLARLQGRIRRCSALALLARDGLVLAATQPVAEWPELARAVPALLVAQGKGLDGGWIDAGAQEDGQRLVLFPWRKGPPLILACWLQPRTRKVNLNEGSVREALQELPRHTRERGGERIDEALEAAARARGLLRRSPLTLAFRPQRNGGLDGLVSSDATAAARLAPLFQGDRATLVRYLDESLARSWLREEVSRRRLPAAEAHAAYRAAGRGLRAFVRAADGRPDALRPVMRFLQGYLLRFGTRIPVVQGFRDQAQGFDRASQRDALLHTAAEVFGLGCDLARASQEALSEAFVDRSEEQKVLLADYHQLYREIEDEVEAIRRELAGEIG